MIPALASFEADRLISILASFPALRIGVLGDFFLDKYLEVDPSLAEPSLETGKTAHQVVGIRHSPGAAGTVVRNLASLGAAELFAFGFTGEDGEGWELRGDLEALGVGLGGLLSSPELATPTYLKPRDRGRPGLRGEHSRYDSKNRRPLPESLSRGILAALDEALPELDLLLVMDQVEEDGTGVLSPLVVGGLLERLSAYPRLLCWADSRRRIRNFRAPGSGRGPAGGSPPGLGSGPGAGLVLKMNQFELAAIETPLPGQSIPEPELLRLFMAAEAKTGARLFVTAAERGVYVREGADLVRIPALRVSGEIDPTGAGDAFSAAAAMALASAASAAEAALLGNLAASVTVRVLGDTGAAEPREVFAAFSAWKEEEA